MTFENVHINCVIKIGSFGYLLRMACGSCKKLSADMDMMIDFVVYVVVDLETP